MSVRVMSLVWDGFPGGGSELLGMLALADWSDEQGRCFPAISAIAEKMRLSRSQAQRIIHSLINRGYVSVIGNEFGGPPGATRQYRIKFESLTGSTDATGRMNARDGSHGCAETGRADATQTISEPPLSVRAREQARSPTAGASSKKGGTTLLAFLETCKATDEKAISDDDPIFEYAERVGISDEMLGICWREFKARYLPTSKKQKDWRAHFRNAVRRNWYGLWFLKEGEPARWTTAGEQARRDAA